MKIIKINTPNGLFAIPLVKVAEHKANEYFDDKLKTLLWKEEVRFIMEDDFEGIDWLINNTDYDDWKDVIHRIRDEDNDEDNDEDFWFDSDNFEIMEISHIIEEKDNDISFEIKDDWNGNSFFYFEDGQIMADGNIRTEGGADDESFSLELTKEQTLELYKNMKLYFGD